VNPPRSSKRPPPTTEATPKAIYTLIKYLLNKGSYGLGAGPVRYLGTPGTIESFDVVGVASTNGTRAAVGPPRCARKSAPRGAGQQRKSSRKVNSTMSNLKSTSLRARHDNDRG
jgi:hypothetical protein